MKTSRILLLAAALLLHLTAILQSQAAPGDVDLSFDPGIGANSTVYSVAVQADGKILIGGYFSSFGGTTLNRIARLKADGSLDASFSPDLGANEYVVSLALQTGGKVIAGGFSGSSGTYTGCVARLCADGAVDSSFNPGCGPRDSRVNSVVVQPDGKVLVGGQFSSFNGMARTNVVRLNVDGTLDSSFSYGETVASFSAVLSVAVQADGKALIGGIQVSLAGTPRGLLARLNADGSVDPGFDAGLGVRGGDAPQVNSIAVQPDGKVLIGGMFTLLDGTERNGIARLNANGSPDSSFNPGTGVSGGVFSYINSMAMQPDGKILLGGQFTSFNGTPRANIVRLNTDGSLDTSFNPGSGVTGGAVPEVYSVALQSDGNVLIGGAFSSVNDIPRNYLARLHTDYLPSRLEINFVGNLPALQLTGDIGQQYFLEYASELTASNNWTALASFVLTNSPQKIVDHTVTNALRRFYRARRLTQ